MNISYAHQIVEYWLGLSQRQHFSKDAEFDGQLRQMYAQDVVNAIEGVYDHWLKDRRATLAIILLLDQISRNIHRDTVDAFKGDAKALEAARTAIDNQYDKQSKNAERVWFYMPFMHSEQLADQELSVALFTELDSNLKYAEEHRAIIHQFGRFPHRNSVLGRDSTPAEKAFLKQGGFSG